MITTESILENGVEQLAEHYGIELANKIKSDIEYCEIENDPWKFEIIYDGAIQTIVAFSTKHWSIVYEVSKRRKEIDEKYIIGKSECEKILNLMKNL